MKQLPTTSEGVQRRKRSMTNIGLFLGISVIFVISVLLVKSWLFPQMNPFGIRVTNLIWSDEEDRSGDLWQDTDNAGNGGVEIIVIPEAVVEQHDKEWLEQNLFRVDTYSENGDGTYTVTLINQVKPTEETFDELKATFRSTPFTEENHYSLDEGVNCKGMVNYIAEWCQQHDHDFAVQYYTDHVTITVKHRERQYLFNFTGMSEIIELR